MENNHLTQLAQEILSSSSAINWKQARSGWKGGQNVNKVSSKAQLSYDIARCSFLNDEQKAQLFNALDNKINKEGELRIDHERSRDFPKNKQACEEKFIDLLVTALTPEKERKVGIPKKIDTTLSDDEQAKQRKLKKTISIAKHKAKANKIQHKDKKKMRAKTTYSEE